VLNWFTSPKESFDDNNYIYLDHQNYNYIVLIHSLPFMLDSIAEKEGIKTDWKDKQNNKLTINISIVCNVEFNGKNEIGIYSLAYDQKTREIYHRCFMTKPANEILKEYLEKGKWEINFPKLENAKLILETAKPENKQFNITKENEAKLINENKFFIKIYDPRNKATITIYKIK
jgi:hypothetical protein